MTSNPPEDPEAGAEGFGATPSSDVLCGSIEAIKPIGLHSRAWFTTQLIDLLQPTPHQRAMRMSVIYTVDEARQACGKRTRSYLRFSLDYDASSDAAEFASRQARRQLEQAFARTQAMLAAHYQLTEIPADPLTVALQASDCKAPPAELCYTRWAPSSQWLAPAHVQPMLDRLLLKPGCSAIVFTVERVSGTLSAPASLRLQVLAYGEATDEMARAPLVDEYRGRGILVVEAPNHDSIPNVQWICPASLPTVSSACQSLAQASRQCGPQPIDVALTAHEAGHLLPLPMVLGHM